MGEAESTVRQFSSGTEALKLGREARRDNASTPCNASIIVRVKCPTFEHAPILGIATVNVGASHSLCFSSINLYNASLMIRCAIHPAGLQNTMVNIDQVTRLTTRCAFMML